MKRTITRILMGATASVTASVTAFVIEVDDPDSDLSADVRWLLAGGAAASTFLFAHF